MLPFLPTERRETKGHLSVSPVSRLGFQPEVLGLFSPRLSAKRLAVAVVELEGLVIQRSGPKVNQAGAFQVAPKSLPAPFQAGVLRFAPPFLSTVPGWDSAWVGPAPWFPLTLALGWSGARGLPFPLLLEAWWGLLDAPLLLVRG